MSNKLSRPLVLGVVLHVLAAFSAAEAYTLIPVTLEDMAGRAERVVVGRVIGQEARYNDSETLILTYTTIEVEQTFVGEAAQTIEIAEYGGRVGQRAMVSPAQVTYEDGERVLVFACRDALGLLRTCGAHQGRLHVAPTEDGSSEAVGLMAGAPVRDSLARLRARVLEARGSSK